MSVRYPIQVVARLSGLSVHVIRIWEKRYGAVQPERTGTKRRLYTDADVGRLRLLRQATELGHGIGLIAKLEQADLERVVSATGLASAGVGEEPRKPRNVEAVVEAGNGSQAGRGEMGSAETDPLVREAVEATQGFAEQRLVAVLERSVLEYGANGALHRVIAPVAWEIGERWQRGQATAAHEHFASELIRDFLRRSARPYVGAEGAPRVVVATPAGQLHELGAVMAAAVATNLGWQAVYLGPSLPAAEIAGAALQNEARMVLLSVVYPGDDPNLAAELRQLGRHLAGAIRMVVGGRAARHYRSVLDEIGAAQPGDLEALAKLLERVSGGESIGRVEDRAERGATASFA